MPFQFPFHFLFVFPLAIIRWIGHLLRWFAQYSSWNKFPSNVVIIFTIINLYNMEFSPGMLEIILLPWIWATKLEVSHMWMRRSLRHKCWRRWIWVSFKRKKRKKWQKSSIKRYMSRRKGLILCLTQYHRWISL